MSNEKNSPTDVTKYRPTRATDLAYLYQTSAKLARHVLRQLGVALCDRDDYVQEAFLRLACTAGEFTGATARAYLCTVLRTLVIDEARTYRRRYVTTLDADCELLADDGAGLESYVYEVSLQAIGAAIDAVRNLDDRRLLVWTYREGLSAKDIAERTGDAVGTVTSKLCRLRSRYRAHFTSWVGRAAA